MFIAFIYFQFNKATREEIHRMKSKDKTDFLGNVSSFNHTKINLHKLQRESIYIQMGSPEDVLNLVLRTFSHDTCAEIICLESVLDILLRKKPPLTFESLIKSCF